MALLLNKNKSEMAESVKMARRSNEGHSIIVAFAPGRTDVSQEQTDIGSFAVLQPKADGYRHFCASDGFPGPALEKATTNAPFFSKVP